MNMKVGNTVIKNRVNHLVTYEFGPSKPQGDYCLVRRNQRNFSKDIKVLPSEDCITQHKSLVCNFTIRKLKNTRRNFSKKKDMKITLNKCNFALSSCSFHIFHIFLKSISGHTSKITGPVIKYVPLLKVNGMECSGWE